MKWYRYTYFVFILAYILLPIILNILIFGYTTPPKSHEILHFILLVILIISGFMSLGYYVYDEDTVLPIDKEETTQNSSSSTGERIYKVILIFILLIFTYRFIMYFAYHGIPILGSHTIYNPLSTFNIGSAFYQDTSSLQILPYLLIELYRFFVVLNNGITYGFFSGGVMLAIELISSPFIRVLSALLLLLFLFITKINGYTYLFMNKDKSLLNKIIFTTTTMGLDHSQINLGDKYTGILKGLFGTDSFAINWVYFMTSIYILFWIPYNIVSALISSTFNSFILTLLSVLGIIFFLVFVLYRWFFNMTDFSLIK